MNKCCTGGESRREQQEYDGYGLLLSIFYRPDQIHSGAYSILMDVALRRAFCHDGYYPCLMLYVR